MVWIDWIKKFQRRKQTLNPTHIKPEAKPVEPGKPLKSGGFATNPQTIRRILRKYGRITDAQKELLRLHKIQKEENHKASFDKWSNKKKNEKALKEYLLNLEKVKLKKEEKLKKLRKEARSCGVCNAKFKTPADKFYCHYCPKAYCDLHRLAEKHGCKGRFKSISKQILESYSSKGGIQYRI